MFTLDQFEPPICRICHCGEGETDSVYEKEVDKLGDQSGLTSISICTDQITIPPPPFSCSSPSSSSTTLPPPSPPASSSGSISQMNLITPCYCSGSLQYVHHYCLQQWIRSSNNKYCELCKHHFKMSVKYKPFHKWERLEMSNGERRKLLYNLLFNLISMFCVFWSIYVLIERATFEAKYGLLDWPFWTKMLVVSIGFLGGSVFLFVQLRLYLSIFLRWRQYNRIIIVHNVDHNDLNAHKLEKNSPSFGSDSNGIK
ncbi:E3 ubiquitin-protein ligase MARCHF1-like [Brevipalpus obovatus]|uniref:E3 ubiquitin-protein ligase MARCHF1-like n=1 Tax=Brevipalpus obovatus TaxID=246614 RepID=UPI003D9E1EBD